MQFLLARIQPRNRTRSPAQALLDVYLDRVRHTKPLEAKEFPTEAALLALLDRAVRRTRPVLILCDSAGQQLTSEAFAAKLGAFIDSGAQEIVLAIGPADGWSAAALGRADLVLAFGRITLPHELAGIVLAEQTYRALTILAGHPYHSGH